MSHFSVLVTLPGVVQRGQLDAALTEALAPYDENVAVEAYRKYEDGPAEDHWFVRSARRGAKHYKDGTGILPYEPDSLGWSSASSKKTPTEQQADLIRDAQIADALGEHPTWPQVLAALAERYPAEVPELVYDPESDRAYAMSTYSPDSKWDYWRVGGRWGGYFLIGTQTADIIATERGWDSPKELLAGHCDGGRKRDLDLAGLRAEKAAEAVKDWDEYQRVVAGTEPALPWSTFAEAVDQSGNGGYTVADARRDYHAQPRVQALDRSEEFKYWDNALETFESLARDEYAARQSARAVPGYALLNAASGENWATPGRMGWFGMSSDDEHSYAEYVRRANDLIDGLSDDDWLVVVDCHI